METVGTKVGLRSRAPLLALLGAGAVSLTGNALTRVAVPWFVLSTGGSGVQVGLALFFETLPLFLGSFFGGALVDRLGHKRSRVVADLASGATLALVPLLYALGALPFGLLLALVFVGALLDAPGAASRQALLPEAAEGAGASLERANAAYQTVFRLAILVGPVVGGALIAVVGATGVFLVDVASFALSATCRLLAANGVKVAVNGRDEARIGAVVDAIRSAGGEALGVVADCTDHPAVHRMREQTEEELGPVGVVAAFAGGGRARPGPLAQTTEEEWHSTVDANLTATFLTLKTFLPGMIERGGGSVVTMSSSAARFPTGAPAPYAAAKAGVIVLTREVANEVGRYGVRANCLAPHTVLVERTRRFMPDEHQQRIASEIPLRRLGTPEDVALATLFLASGSSSWITGVTLDVAGGKVTD